MKVTFAGFKKDAVCDLSGKMAKSLVLLIVGDQPKQIAEKSLLGQLRMFDSLPDIPETSRSQQRAQGVGRTTGVAEGVSHGQTKSVTHGKSVSRTDGTTESRGKTDGEAA